MQSGILTHRSESTATMEIRAFQKLLITGDDYFIRRFRYLTQAMSAYTHTLECMPTPPVYKSKWVRKLSQLIFKLRYGRTKDPATFYKNARNFVCRSKQLEHMISELPQQPDHVFHVFGMCVPSWNRNDVPFSMLIDFTMDMCRRLYPPWGIADWREWVDVERRGYQKASHIFTAGCDVKRSLVNVYNVDPAKVTVVGLPGVFPKLFEGKKSYGSQQMLFYNLEFHRKGGDLVLQSFAKIRERVPNAKLIVIGEKDHIPEMPGVENRGWQTLEQLQELFLQTDLIVAPARCEPFGQFMVEAMNFGIPCVATVREGNGIANFIDHGIDGMLVTDASPENLSNISFELLSNPARLAKMGELARCKVRNQLTSDVVAATIIDRIRHCHR
jgi:glycogen synthase